MTTVDEPQAAVMPPSRLAINLGIGEYVIGAYGSKGGRSYLVIERNTHGKPTGHPFGEGQTNGFPPDSIVIYSSNLAAWGVLHKVLNRVIETDALRLALEEVEIASA